MGRIFSVLLMEDQRGLDPRKYFFVLLIAIGLSILPANLGFAMGSKNRPDGKGLYLYSGKDITRFLEKIGYPDLAKPPRAARDITKNSDGTALRFFDWSNKKGIVVTCDGSISEINVPGYAAWFNDENHAIAWLDNDRRKVHYRTGVTEDPPFKAYGGADPSGSYFMKLPRLSSSLPRAALFNTEVYSTEDPDLPLIKVEIYGHRIFSKGEKVYLFGSSYDNGKDTIRLHIFTRHETRLTPLEEVIIHRPETSPTAFSVEDLSPWKDEVLLLDVYDWPSRSIWYVFNLETHEMKKIGKEPFWGGRGFYLQCDIIKEVTNKLKKPGK